MKENQILAVTETVLDLWGDHISTHYDGCWERHVACLASLIRSLIIEDPPDMPPESYHPNL